MLKIYNIMKRTIASTKGKVLEDLVCPDLNRKMTELEFKRREQIFNSLYEK